MKRFITIVLALACAVTMTAQQMPELPTDPSIKIGKLDNGMTYYIRHNDKPAQRAEFYLATHVGAVQETTDQDGLAHFLEHMCFNGTKNFPGKDLLNWLESIGASFGGNINASTGMEVTQYMLNNIPLTRETIIDSCLLVMHDYSHFVSLDHNEIDDERGVIIEEKRTRNTSSWRSFMESKKYYFKGCALESTSIIGSQEQLETFAYSSLENFYKKWYNPDMQALVVVGDIDVAAIEAKIKDIFSDIPAPEVPTVKEPVVVPDNKEPIIGIVTDPENTASTVEMVWKSSPLPMEYRNTAIGVVTEICKGIFGNAMNERLNEISSKADAPFLSASFGIGSLCENNDAVFAEATAREGEAIKSLEALFTEVERMRRYGFTAAEYERAKAEVLTSIENAAAKAETRKNADFIRPILNNFFNGAPLLDPEMRKQIAQQMMKMLNDKQLNQMAAELITEENLVVLYNGPQKEGLANPTEQEILSTIEAVRAAEISAPAQESASKELLNAKKIKGCKVKSESEGIHGSTVLELANGVKVVLLPTEYEKNNISIQLSIPGGQSIIDTEDLPSFERNIWSLFTSNTGVSKFSNTELGKMLAGKTVSASPYIGNLYHGINASATPKDVETALQLLYLSIVDPRFDEQEWNVGINQLREMLPNMMENPNFKLNSSLQKAIYGGNPRQVVLCPEVLDKASLKVVEKNYRKLFKNVGGATVYVVGDFQVEDLKPLLVKYIGALPKGKADKAYIDRDLDIISGTHRIDEKAKMEAPKVTVLQLYKIEGKEYNEERNAALNALYYILDMVYTATLREGEGGTYGASAYAFQLREPKCSSLMQVAFETNVDVCEHLIDLAKQGLVDIAKNGPTAEQFDKTYKYLGKTIPEKRITNRYWEGVIENWNMFGGDSDAAYEAAVLGLTPEKIQAVAADFLEGGNYIEFVFGPEM